ncbi:EhaF family protein [Methanoculleus sp. 7T]|uniref:EhaF family protein n=1 Tax=Methanoculleus sp. 7T TaxID=2937282 RepID=UPI0020BDBECC|nr:EhaF family protein [Methanoculleus sp. 7T]MCK8519563.1 EhaF family protein [Methanoculleus sp. 7T]
MKANRSIITRISATMSRVENLTGLYAFLLVAVAVLGLVTLPFITYHDDQLYPKTINPDSTLNPYDRGGVPFGTTPVKAQYPENSPYAGYVTTYLTPVSQWLADTTYHMGTTIVSHPGGIIDEILYNTRGLDTVVETSILFVAFAIASYLFRRDS